MPRIAIDLNNSQDRQRVKGQWRVADGLVSGEPNEGLVSQLEDCRHRGLWALRRAARGHLHALRDLGV